MTVRSKTWLEINGQFAIGEYGFDLLRRAETALGENLLIQRSGKGARRGAELSMLARELIRFDRRGQAPGA